MTWILGHANRVNPEWDRVLHVVVQVVDVLLDLQELTEWERVGLRIA